MGGKCIFFPQLVKIMHIFSPIDLKYTKLQKKRLTFFACSAHYLIIINFCWGKNINQEGGEGKNMNSESTQRKFKLVKRRELSPPVDPVAMNSFTP